MCTVLLPPGVYPPAVNKYVISLVHAMKTYGGVELYFHSLLILGLDESFCIRPLCPRGKDTGIPWRGSRADLGVLGNTNIPCTLPKIIIEQLIFPRPKLYNYESEQCKYSKHFKLFVTSFVYFWRKYLSKDSFKFATILVSGDCPIPSSNFAPQPFKFLVIGNYNAETERVGSVGKASDTCLEMIGLIIGWDTVCRDTDFSWVFLIHSI